MLAAATALIERSFLLSLKLDLFGAVTGNCLRAAIALEEAGILFTPRKVDLSGNEQATASFLALNPLGKVPVLVDRSGAVPFVLTQSNAIVFHAASIAPDRLITGQGGQRAALVLERFFFFLTDVIAPSHAGFFLQRAGEPDGASLLQERYAAAALQAEHFLKHNEYMAGAEFSIADIAAFTILKSLRETVPWDGSPEMAEWFRRVEARPAVQRGLRAFD